MTVGDRKPILVSILVGSSVLAALCSAALIADQGNSLNNNGSWTSAKMTLEKGVVGATAFFVTRTALSHHRLNLAAWHGFQEVWYREKIAPEEISFGFNLPEGSYINFIYGKDANGFRGIRISRDPRSTSMLFKANTDGAFTYRKELPGVVIARAKNNASFAKRGPAWAFFLNGTRIVDDQSPLPPSFQFGFKGGPHEAFVTSVSARSAGGAELVRESFRPGGFWAFPLTLLLFGGLAWVGVRAKGLAEASALLCAAALASIACLSVDWLWLSGRYPENVDFSGFHQTIEFDQEIIDHISDTYAENRVHPVRLLFLGSSQTWGAGAQRVEDTFVARLERGLNRGRSPSRSYQVINAGISGARSGSVLQYYREHWLALDPAVVIINLSTNDSGDPEFAGNVEKMVALSGKRKVLLVEEANQEDLMVGGLLNNHAILRQLSRKTGAAAFDLHTCLLVQKDSGFLWWDYVHLTSYGQELAARCLLPVISRLVPALP